MWYLNTRTIPGTTTVMTVVSALFVEYMKRCRVGPGQTERAFEFLCVWMIELIRRRYWCLKRYEVVNNLTLIMWYPNTL